MPKSKPFKNNSDYSLYNSHAWRKFAKHYKDKHPLCVACEKEGRVTAADVLDHITRVADGGAVWSTENLQSLCHPCHNSKSAKEKHGYKQTAE